MSRFLVGAQFAAIAVLIVPPGQVGNLFVGVALVAAGLLWLGWAVSANRPGNFHVRPVARSGARLVTSGPYRLVRHPMYFGVLVSGAGLVVLDPAPLKAGAWLALLGVLLAKTRLEEAALRRQFPEYEMYRRQRRFLVPWIW